MGAGRLRGAERVGTRAAVVVGDGVWLGAAVECASEGAGREAEEGALRGTEVLAALWAVRRQGCCAQWRLEACGGAISVGADE